MNYKELRRNLKWCYKQAIEWRGYYVGAPNNMLKVYNDRLKEVRKSIRELDIRIRTYGHH